MSNITKDINITITLYQTNITNTKLKAEPIQNSTISFKITSGLLNGQHFFKYIDFCYQIKPFSKLSLVYSSDNLNNNKLAIITNASINIS